MSLLADLVLCVHLAFIVFVAVGAFGLFVSPKLAWVHVPAVLWGVYVEWTASICPLTTLEVWLRVQAGATGYGNSFVDQYIVPVVYPPGLTPGLQFVLGTVVLVVNLIIYWIVFLRGRDR